VIYDVSLNGRRAGIFNRLSTLGRALGSSSAKREPRGGALALRYADGIATESGKVTGACVHGIDAPAVAMKRPREDRMSPLERVAVALALALAGFLTAILAWWLLTPPLDVSVRTYLALGGVLAVVFFGYGLSRPEQAVDRLGAIWKFLWRISSEVLKYFSMFRR
jgi:hypothetical protein